MGNRRLAEDKTEADTLKPPSMPPNTPLLYGTYVTFFQESPNYLHVNSVSIGKFF